MLADQIFILESTQPGYEPTEKIGDSPSSPLMQGGEDDDALARERRDHVKGVSCE